MAEIVVGFVYWQKASPLFIYSHINDPLWAGKAEAPSGWALRSNHLVSSDLLYSPLQRFFGLGQLEKSLRPTRNVVCALILCFFLWRLVVTSA